MREYEEPGRGRVLGWRGPWHGVASRRVKRLKLCDLGVKWLCAPIWVDVSVPSTTRTFILHWNVCGRRIEDYGGPFFHRQLEVVFWIQDSPSRFDTQIIGLGWWQNLFVEERW